MSFGLRPSASRGSGPLPCFASSPRPCGSGKILALPDRAEQRREVDEVLGNHMNDLTLPLYPAATPDHVCRENEPALPLEQGRPDDEVRDVRLVFQRDEQNAIG